MLGMLAAATGSLKVSVRTSPTWGRPAVLPGVVSVIAVRVGLVVLTLTVATAEVVELPALSKTVYSYS